MFKASQSSQGDLNGFLDAGSRMNGELQFDDTFRIDGHFSGAIRAKGDLVVGEGGVVEAEVEARRIFISGVVRGSVRALERLEITAQGRVYAELVTPSLSVEDGAFFEGRCSMKTVRSEPASVPHEGKVTAMPLAKKDGRKA